MAPEQAKPTMRSASQLPKVEGRLAFDSSTTSNAHLPDLNVWLTLATPDHFHHQPAVKTTHEASAILQALCQQPGMSLAIPASNGWDVFHQLMREGDLTPALAPTPTLQRWPSAMAAAW